MVKVRRIAGAFFQQEYDVFGCVSCVYAFFFFAEMLWFTVVDETAIVQLASTAEAFRVIDRDVCHCQWQQRCLPRAQTLDLFYRRGVFFRLYFETQDKHSGIFLWVCTEEEESVVVTEESSTGYLLPAMLSFASVLLATCMIV